MSNHFPLPLSGIQLVKEAIITEHFHVAYFIKLCISLNSSITAQTAQVDSSKKRATIHVTQIPQVKNG